MTKTIAILLVLVAIAFLGIGAIKVLGYEPLERFFVKWGYHNDAIYLIGIAEILGALGLLIERIRIWAVVLLACDMLRIIVTHSTTGELKFAIPTIFLAILAITIVFKTWVVASRHKEVGGNTSHFT